ncbi:hypothetical protein K438DRAFT_1754773 [Mycena galopus ATCC 62051]|nr:hypothetical protein K438DRAFT_1754773 [Mycena galopus ATCC 62051]
MYIGSSEQRAPNKTARAWSQRRWRGQALGGWWPNRKMSLRLAARRTKENQESIARGGRVETELNRLEMICFLAEGGDPVAGAPCRLAGAVIGIGEVGEGRDGDAAVALDERCGVPNNMLIRQSRVPPARQTMRHRSGINIQGADEKIERAARMSRVPAVRCGSGRVGWVRMTQNEFSEKERGKSKKSK